VRRGGARRAPFLPAAAAACLLLSLSGTCPLRAESIYYEKGEDGTIRLTNAPGNRDYHTYLTTGHSPGTGEVPPGPYSDPIRRAGKTFGVDPRLIRAVIAAESNYNPSAVSPKGARGLMQLMPATAQRFGVKDIFDPVQNIFGGVQYLRHLLDLFEGDLVLALAAYNAGERIVQETGGVPGYRETRDYVDRVMARYGRPGVAARGSQPGGAPPSAATVPARKTPIYRAVAGDGALVFSDSPISKPVRD
jgi:soluble lytic murein transglycosylase-like protein